MPSPLAHLAAGYVAARHIADVRFEFVNNRNLLLLGVAAGLSILPDLDFGPGILVGDPGRYHNGFSHSLFFTLLTALAVGALGAATRYLRFRAAFALALTCYGLHIVMDYFTIGRGVMLLWPFTSERFTSPVPLFYGVRWSQGFTTPLHLWTILTEAVFVALVLCLSDRFAQRRRRPSTAEGQQS